MAPNGSPRAGTPMQWLVLALLLLICLGTAGLGAAFTNLSVGDWYRTLKKPSWNPPNAVFGPVWTALYIAMAAAAWLVWRTGPPDRGRALAIFGIQLALNLAWSALFFGLRKPGLALVDIVLLWGAILATTIAFAGVSTVAAGLLLPYLAWVAFAAALNAAIVRLNQ